MWYTSPTKEQLRKLTGKRVYAIRKDGDRISGKLIRNSKGQYAIRPDRKAASTKAIIPLVLFDLLAIGTSPFAFGFPYGYPYGGFGPGFFF